MAICESTLFYDRTIFVRTESVGGVITSFIGIFIVFNGKVWAVVQSALGNEA